MYMDNGHALLSLGRKKEFKLFEILIAFWTRSVICSAYYILVCRRCDLAIHAAKIGTLELFFFSPGLE